MISNESWVIEEMENQNTTQPNLWDKYKKGIVTEKIIVTNDYEKSTVRSKKHGYISRT